jgi:glycosyltransferase involved in cell wall biosynthesis
MAKVKKAATSQQDATIALSPPVLPSLSFVMPTYNREKTIGAALEQISAQICNSKFRSQLSVLISENQSTDRSGEIAQRFAARHDFIRVVSPAQHLPSGEHNLFFAIQHVDSDFVWSFADDDLLLPGAIDWIFERLCESKADFVLINSQYQDSNGQVLRDSILDMGQSVITFNSFGEIFTEIGPLTLLASFSSGIFRPKKVCALDLDSFLKPCAIYAHVFAYLEAFAQSKVEVWSVPLVVLRRTTATAHWEQVAKRYNWYLYYPWTGSLANHLLRAREHGAIRSDQYGFALNSNENGRYGLIANLLTQFILQMLRAIEVGDPREVPGKADFEKIRMVVQDIPFVTIETLDLLLWAERYFGDICALVAQPGTALQQLPSALTNVLQTLDSPAQTSTWINKVREKLVEKLHSIKLAYVNFGTMSAEGRPYAFMVGRKYVIFQLASRFVLMTNTIFQEDWRAMNPNRLDPVDQAPDWFIFPTFSDALTRYFALEQANVLAESDSDERVMRNLAKNPPWDALAEIIESEDIDALLDNVTSDAALNEVQEALAIIFDLPDATEPIDLCTLELARDGFINPVWYRESYASRVQGFESDILRRSPVLHYLMLGARKGWSLSPFFDERSQRGVKSSVSRSPDSLIERSGLAKYLANGSAVEMSDYFSVDSYLDQCNERDIELEQAPIIHFLSTGIHLGMSPHPKWNEAAYLDANPDVKQLRGGLCSGWLHWCRHGRFEKRPGAFTNGGK